MANEGKYTDRSPYLPAAGLVSTWSKADVQRCFEHGVSREEKRVQWDCRSGPRDHQVLPGRADIYRGFDTDARRCLQPEADRGFGLAATLTDELRDTVYNSYWSRPLGRVADHTPGLPPLDRVHGRATERSHGAGELINPRTTYVKVRAEAGGAHEVYRKTHAGYEPGEQASRCYVWPYRKDLVWGKPTPCDPQNGCVKKAISSKTDRKVLVSKILADLKKRTDPLVGKVVAPNDNATLMAPDHAYGRSNRRSATGSGELLRECAPSLDRVDMLEELAYINQLRGRLHKEQPPVSYRDLEFALHEQDVNGSGHLSAVVASQIMSEHKIHPRKSLFDRFLTRTNILSEDGHVAYKKMLDLLNVNVEFPELSQIKDVPDEFLYFETTNQIVYKYHCTPDAGESAAVAVAGSPARAHEDVGALLSPNAFTAYGLHPRRFFEPTSPQAVRALIDRLGRQLDDTTFKNVWNLAQNDKECVSIQRFLDTLNSLR